MSKNMITMKLEDIEGINRKNVAKLIIIMIVVVVVAYFLFLMNHIILSAIIFIIGIIVISVRIPITSLYLLYQNQNKIGKN